jgi:hypothetical protein
MLRKADVAACMRRFNKRRRGPKSLALAEKEKKKHAPFSKLRAGALPARDNKNGALRFEGLSDGFRHG